MLVLLLIGLIAGVATALSPCVLPVLPVLLAGGASGRKPFRIIAGLVLSFSAFTLFASWLLGKLGLPQDLLRNLAIVLLFLMAAVLLTPQAAGSCSASRSVSSSSRAPGRSSARSPLRRDASSSAAGQSPRHSRTRSAQPSRCS